MSETTLKANGLTFRVRMAGDGEPVLLLHGFPELSLSWRHQLPALAEAGLRAVAPDMRGYGGTDRPARVADYDLDVLADDVAGLIDALGVERASVVGHDWGGAVAFHFAQRHPDRLRRLAVLNCPHPYVMMRALRSSWAQRKRSWYMLFFQLPWLPEYLIRRDPEGFAKGVFLRTAAKRDAFTPDDLKAYADEASRSRGVGGGLNYYRASARLAPARMRARIALWKQPIEAPTLLVWGTQDTALGEELVDPHERVVAPGRLRVVRIPTSGHWVQQEEPGPVNDALVAHLTAGEGGPRGASL